MKYTEFQRIAVDAGLDARQCSTHHWQLLGGSRNRLVNVWANSKQGFRFQVEGSKSQGGRMKDAIELAGVVRKELAPWEDSEPLPQPVGMIRRWWRWIW